jgi:hypothetical protein
LPSRSAAVKSLTLFFVLLVEAAAAAVTVTRRTVLVAAAATEEGRRSVGDTANEEALEPSGEMAGGEIVRKVAAEVGTNPETMMDLVSKSRKTAGI